MKINCSIIKDILPLYVENVVSDDTRFFVENHLQDCEKCKKEIEEMKGFENIPIDINTNQLKNIKTKFFKEKFKMVIFSVLITITILIIAINYLIKPRYLSYSSNVISINSTDNGILVMNLENKISNYEINKYKLEDSDDYIYHIDTWTTFWDDFFNNKNTSNIILNPNGEKIDAIYYSNNTNKEGDILIYGNSIINDGEIMSLPRVVFSYYYFIAITFSIIILIFLRVFRNNRKIKNIIEKILFIPIAYVIGQFLIKGFNLSSYKSSYDFFMIILIVIPIYFIIMFIKDFYEGYKESNLEKKI